MSEDPPENKELPGNWRLGLFSLFPLQARVQLVAICPFLFCSHLLSGRKPQAGLLLWVEVGGKGEDQRVMKTQATIQIDGIKS